MRSDPAKRITYGRKPQDLFVSGFWLAARYNAISLFLRSINKNQKRKKKLVTLKLNIDLKNRIIHSDLNFSSTLDYVCWFWTRICNLDWISCIARPFIVRLSQWRERESVISFFIDQHELINSLIPYKSRNKTSFLSSHRESNFVCFNLDEWSGKSLAAIWRLAKPSGTSLHPHSDSVRVREQC